MANHDDGASGPGIGLEFFAIATEVRNSWDVFITSLRSVKQGDGYSEISQNLRDMLPPPHVREMLRKMREAGEIVQAPQLQRPAPELKPVVVEVAPQSIDRLRLFADRVDRSQSVFLKPKHQCHLGQKVNIALTHPDTDEEHVVYAVIERVVTSEDGNFAGVQVRF